MLLNNGIWPPCKENASTTCLHAFPSAHTLGTGPNRKRPSTRPGNAGGPRSKTFLGHSCKKTVCRRQGEKKNHSLKASTIIILREENRGEKKAKSLKAYSNPNAQIFARTTSPAWRVIFVPDGASRYMATTPIGICLMQLELSWLGAKGVFYKCRRPANADVECVGAGWG